MGSNSVLNILLFWLNRLAKWALGLFDLSEGFSPLKWLANNWLGILIALLIIGLAVDLLVWLLRWRPHWIWFNKKRIIIDDDHFFDGEELIDSGLYDPALFAEKPVKRAAPKRGVVPSTIVKRVPRGERASDDIFSVSEDAAFDVSDLPLSEDEKKFRRRRGK